MKRSNLDYLCGSVIVAIVALTVFAGGTNACHHNAETMEQTSTEPSQETDEKTEIEV